MKQLSRSKAAAKLFSPAALALAVGLACWGSAALAANEPIPGVDIIVKKNPGDSIVVTPTSDHSGKFSVKLGPGDYTVSTACKSGGCTPSRISIDIKDYNEKLEADGSTSYEFHVGKGGIELRGQTLSLDPPSQDQAKVHQSEANRTANAPNGKIVELKGAQSPDDVIHSDRTPSKFPPGSGPVSTTVKLQQPPPNQLRGKETGGGDTTPHNKYADDFKQLNTERVEKPDDPQKPGKKHNYKGVVTLVKKTYAPSGGEGDDLPGKKHNYVGSVTLVRGMAPNPGSGDETPPGLKYADDFKEMNEARTANPTNDVDTTPQNKYADDFKQLNSKRPVRIEKSVAVKSQVTALQTAVAGLPTTASSSAPSSTGEKSAPKKSSTHLSNGALKAGVPPPVDPVGPPVKVQLRNVDTGALAGTTVLATGTNFPDNDGLAVTTLSSANGEFTFTGLSVGNYVVEIVDAAVKIIGTSASIAVGSGGKVGGNLMRGPDGSMSIFDRWGESLTAPLPKTVDIKQDTPDQTAGSKAAESPGGFGDGMGGSPGRGPDIGGMGGGPNPGMMSPPGGVGSGPVNPMSGGGPAGGPGAMSPGGPSGPGGPGAMSPGGPSGPGGPGGLGSPMHP